MPNITPAPKRAAVEANVGRFNTLYVGTTAINSSFLDQLTTISSNVSDLADTVTAAVEDLTSALTFINALKAGMVVIDSDGTVLAPTS